MGWWQVQAGAGSRYAATSAEIAEEWGAGSRAVNGRSLQAASHVEGVTVWMAEWLQQVDM